ncbi:MAG TPA: hypothetical protein VK766_11960, partial [Cytophagaceae bacterium]|nr:hypothetical protein [Cytophagaceae bacterium]
MLTNKEDYINIGLMLISCLLAFMLPFELFLFSYAILGPLHYLTEISWLHQRNYFSTGKRDYAILVILCLLISIGVIFQDIFVTRKLFASVFSSDTSLHIMKVYTPWFTVFIFGALVGSISLIAFKKMYSKLIFFAVSLALGYLLR